MKVTADCQMSECRGSVLVGVWLLLCSRYKPSLLPRNAACSSEHEENRVRHPGKWTGRCSAPGSCTGHDQGKIPTGGIDTCKQKWAAANVMSNGGVCILTSLLGAQTTIVSVTTNWHCTNFRGETEALVEAASVVQASHYPCQQVFFPSGGLYILRTLENDKLHEPEKVFSKCP